MRKSIDGSHWVKYAIAFLLSQAVLESNPFWINWCSGFSSGIDCQTGAEGNLSDMVSKPLDLGRVLDDPNGGFVVLLSRDVSGM